MPRGEPQRRHHRTVTAHERQWLDGLEHPRSQPSGMRRALIVTYPYFPSYHVGVRRVAQLCRYLPDHGWEPVILTKQWDGVPLVEDAFFGGLRSNAIEQEIGYRPTTIIASYESKDNAVLRLHRRLVAAGAGGPAPLGAARVVARKALSATYWLFGEWPDRFVGWLPHATRAGVKAVRSLDVAAIVSVCPPHTDHLVGGSIARATRRPWIAVFDDLANFYLGPGDLRDSSSRAIAKRINKHSLRGVQAVTANTPHMLAYLAAEYGVSGDVMVPGYSPQSRGAPPRGNRFRISLTGSMYLSEQRPELLFVALDMLLARDLAAREQLEVTLLGTRVEQSLRAMLAGRPCEAVVRVIERLPVEAALKLQRDSHLLLVFNQCGPQTQIGTMSFPSKMYEYLGARRPILALPADPGGWGEEVLARTGAGQSADTASEAAALIARSLDEWRRSGRLTYCGKEEAMEQFSAPSQTRVLATLLDRVADSNTRRVKPRAR